MSNTSKRLIAALLAILLLASFVACGKDDEMETPSSQTQTSSSAPGDDADNMTESEFERIESEFFENVEPEIEITSSSNVSSTESVSESSGATSSEEKWLAGWY